MALLASLRFVAPNAEAMLGASWSKLLPYSNFVFALLSRVERSAAPPSGASFNSSSGVDVVNSFGLTHTARPFIMHDNAIQMKGLLE